MLLFLYLFDVVLVGLDLLPPGLLDQLSRNITQRWWGRLFWRGKLLGKLIWLLKIRCKPCCKCWPPHIFGSGFPPTTSTHSCRPSRAGWRSPWWRGCSWLPLSCRPPPLCLYSCSIPVRIYSSSRTPDCYSWWADRYIPIPPCRSYSSDEVPWWGLINSRPDIYFYRILSRLPWDIFCTDVLDLWLRIVWSKVRNTFRLLFGLGVNFWGREVACW